MSASANETPSPNAAMPHEMRAGVIEIFGEHGEIARCGFQHVAHGVGIDAVPDAGELVAADPVDLALRPLRLRRQRAVISSDASPAA